MNGRPNLDNLSGLPINAVDIAVVLVLLISGVLAYARGFVHETLAVGGWVGAFIATVEGYPYLQPHARDLIPTDLVADFAAGTAIFVVSLVVLSLVTRAISSRVKESALNALDRALGFLFGLVRGAVLVCVAYIGLEFMIPREEQPEWITTARSLPLIVQGASAIVSLLPEDARIEIPDLDAEAVDDIMDLVQPSTGSSSDPENKQEGYSDEPRQEIDQLFENIQ